MITPYRIAVTDAAVQDLRRRIDAARWPPRLEGASWDWGTEHDSLRALVAYWRHDFDWRAAEARLNAVPQAMVRIDNMDTHILHLRSPHAHATPLLLTHGWPGSVVEFLSVLPRLTEPEQYGGDARLAFHVVCPALPGYGFSAPAAQPGMGIAAIAARHLALMSALGYERFIAQGGDWGAMVTRHLPELAPERLIGLHLNMMLSRPPADVAEPWSLATEAEAAAAKRERAARRERMGYVAVQSTRPESLAYGLTDSPVGLCGWIAEKFHDWTDHQGDLRDAVSWDDLLTNISLYWFSNCIGASLRLYKEHLGLHPSQRQLARRVDVPTGVAVYPAELQRPVRAWVEAEYNLVHWYEAPRGGHFAAMEQPDLFARDLQAFRAKLT